jgi:o-succinylbenzoate---CoA ligase
MQTLFAQNKSFSFDEVKSGNFFFEDEYLQEVFLFCKKWLEGSTSFEFNTSGSTGAPTSIHAQREHMIISANITIEALNLDNTEHIYLCINAKMIGGAMMLVRGLELGCDVTIVHPTSNPLEKIPHNHPYSLASFVPMQIYEVSKSLDLQQKLSFFNHILLGGAPASAESLKALALLPCKVWQTYGMTETLSHIALKRVGIDQYYQTLPGVKIRVDERMCLCIEAAVTNNQWMLTNDVINLIDETHFELIGRIDDVINSGGIKVFSYDVEHTLMEKMIALGFHAKSLFVCRKPDEKYGEVVVAVILGERLSDEVLTQITDDCREKLGKYAAPRHIYFVDEFEKLESGKLNKKATLQKILLANTI